MKSSTLLLLAFSALLVSYCQVSASNFSWLSLLKTDDQLKSIDTNITTRAPDVPIPRQCLMCKFLVNMINYSLQTKAGAAKAQRIANSFCTIAKLESPDICENITTLFQNEFVKVLTFAVMTPDQVCGAITHNKCGHYNDPFADWEINLNASLLLDQQQMQQIRQSRAYDRNSVNAEVNKPYRIIHISDTHVDLEYKEGSIAVCGEPLCCKPTSKPDDKTFRIDKQMLTTLDQSLQNSSFIGDRAGFWGSYAHCDVPMRTFESALKKLNETIASSDDINYIIWTGDIQPHDVWKQSKQRAIEVFNEVFKKIFHYLPNARVFPTLGNHEMVPVDSFSPSNLLKIAGDDSPNWLYEDLSTFWLRWIPQHTLKTITVDGFYAVKVRPDLKLISLNTNFCHNKNFWLYINATDPGNQLEWLIHELQISEFGAEFVHIIGHIPPGTEDCLSAWSKNYNRIVSRFKHTITGQFFGHTHNGEFEVFYDFDEALALRNNKSKASLPIPISVGFIAPSITTFVGVNPGFRIYTIDPNRNYMATDFDTYYMNLTEANIKSQAIENSAIPEKIYSPQWNNIGSFSRLLQTKDTSPESLESIILEAFEELDASSKAIPEVRDNEVLEFNITPNVVESKLGENSKLFRLYRLYYNYSDLFTKKIFDEIPNSKKREFLCRLLTSQSHATNFCKDFMNSR